MKPNTQQDDLPGDGGTKPLVSDSEDIDYRGLTCTEPTHAKDAPAETGRSSKRSSGKNSRAGTRHGDACPVPQQTADGFIPPEGFSDTAIVDSQANGPPPIGALRTPGLQTAAHDAEGCPSVVPDRPTAEILQSTLLSLKMRKLPAGPLPKMNEMVARFMNMSPKQWQLLNETIDDLNGRFKHGALHWLLVRWLVAAHPEQFFPPPFSSYQQLLQQVSQKDAEVAEARKDAAKWRDTCARLEAERERWTRQLQQMEEEVSGLYTALAEQEKLQGTREEQLPPQPKQEPSGKSADNTDVLPAQNEGLSRGAQHDQQQHCQTDHQDQQQQELQRRSQQLYGNPEEPKQRHYRDSLQEPAVQKERDHTRLLLPPLAHPASIPESAVFCEQPPVALDVPREEEKKVANTSNASSATTTTKTKTTVTTTTKSSTTSSHSVSVTKDVDPLGPSLDGASKRQPRELPIGKNQSPLQTGQQVGEAGKPVGEASLASVLSCIQNLLRGLTTDRDESIILCPPSDSASSHEGEDAGLGDDPSSPRTHALKGQARKMQKKNVELWYLQYQQQNGPSAGGEETRKKKGQRHQNKREKDKKKKHHGDEKRRSPHGRDRLESTEDEQHGEVEEKRQNDLPASEEDANSVDGSTTVWTPNPEASRQGKTGTECQEGNTQIGGGKHADQESFISHSSVSKAAASSTLAADAPVPHSSPTVTTPRDFPPAEDLRQIQQRNSSVKAYVERFMARYRGGPHIPDTIAKRLFIDNLDPDLRRYVQARHPTSLMHAIVVARQAERHTAGSAPRSSSVRAPRRDIAACDCYAVPAYARKRDCHAPKRAEEVCAVKEDVHNRGQQWEDCRSSVTPSCGGPQCTSHGHDRHSAYPHQQGSLTNTESNAFQWPQKQEGTRPTHLPHSHQQQQRQALHSFDADEGDIWHSSEDTLRSNGGDYVLSTAHRDVQKHGDGEDEKRPKVPSPLEITVVVPRTGATKHNSREKTHIVGRMLNRRHMHPRDS